MVKAYFDPGVASRVAGSARNDPAFKKMSVLNIYKNPDGTFFPANITEKDKDIAPGKTASLTSRQIEKAKLSMQVSGEVWNNLVSSDEKMMLMTREGGLQVAQRIVQELTGNTVENAMAMGVSVFDETGHIISQKKKNGPKIK